MTDWGLIQTIISVIVGIIAMIAIIVAIKLAKKYQLRWAYSTRHIIGRDAEAPPELKYMFGDRQVTEVYKTEIILFNKGNEKFCGDLSPGSTFDINEPINIKIQGAELLRTPNIKQKSKGASSFSAYQNNTLDTITLNIPILNHNEGAIIELWHTKYTKIEIPNFDVPLIKGYITRKPKHIIRNIILWGTIILALITGLWFVTNKNVVTDISFFIFFVGVMLGAASAYLTTSFSYKKFPKWARTDLKAEN